MASPDWLEQWKAQLPAALPEPMNDGPAAPPAGPVASESKAEGRELAPVHDRNEGAGRADPPDVTGEWQPSGTLMPPLARAVKGFRAARPRKPAKREKPTAEPEEARGDPQPAAGVPIVALAVAGGLVVLVVLGAAWWRRRQRQRPEGPAPVAQPQRPTWGPMGPTIEQLREWEE